MLEVLLTTAWPLLRSPPSQPLSLDKASQKCHTFGGTILNLSSLLRAFWLLMSLSNYSVSAVGASGIPGPSDPTDHPTPWKSDPGRLLSTRQSAKPCPKQGPGWKAARLSNPA